MVRPDEENVGAGAGARDSSVDVEKLGRQRPEVFKSTWAELGFGFSVFCSMLLAEFFVSGFHVILPPLAQELNIPQASQTWPSSVFSLITGAMLLPMGRLGDMYGGYLVFNGGLLWFFIWALIAGFSKNYMMLIFCRALQGFGPAAYLPGGVMLMGKIYRPGPRKNLIFALYGAFAPLGFFLGILVGGLAAQFLTWRWYFWIGTIVFAVVTGVSLLAVPFDFRDRRTDIRMDWWGVATIVPGLLLVVYALTDSSHAPDGWATPYIIVTLILGVFFLVGAWYVENYKAKNPLLPADLFAPKYMKRLTAALFMGFGTFGLFLFYSSFYIELVLHKSPLTTAI
ncbi:major facilitator superfamily transporter, partial [Fusarium albosuccineum]